MSRAGDTRFCGSPRDLAQAPQERGLGGSPSLARRLLRLVAIGQRARGDAFHGRILLRRVVGIFPGAPNDSVLIYVGDGVEVGRGGSWAGAAVVWVSKATGGRCTDGERPDVVLRVARAIDGVVAGAQ